MRFLNGLFVPLKSFRVKYLPLLMIYFAYGASGLIDLPLSFWVKDNLALTAVQLASVAVWVSIPWTIKMIFGQMLDSVRIFGSRRKVYIFMGALCTSIGLCMLAGMAGDHVWVRMLPSPFAVFLSAKLMIILGFVIQDVTADTMTTEVVPRTCMAQNGGSQSRVVSRDEHAIKHDLAMVQILGRLALYLGMIAVAQLSGFFVTWVAVHDSITYETVFWISLCIPLLSCVGAVFVRTDRSGDDETLEIHRPDITVVAATCLLGLVTIGIGLGKVFFLESSVLFSYSDEIIFVVSLGILVWMMRHVMWHEAPEKQRVLYLTVVALFVYRLVPHTGEGLLWWMIDVLKFDPQYFGVLKLIAAVVPLAVLWFFSELIASCSVKKILIFLILVGAVLSLPELLLYYGGEGVRVWARNIIICDTVLESPLANISMIPLLTVIAYYAPPQNRGTWFAVGTSLLNLALTGSMLLTKYLNVAFTIQREVLDPATGEIIVAADYSQLGILMICKIGFMIIVPMAAVYFCFKTKTDNEVYCG